MNNCMMFCNNLGFIVKRYTGDNNKMIGYPPCNIICTMNMVHCHVNARVCLVPSIFKRLIIIPNVIYVTWLLCVAHVYKIL